MVYLLYKCEYITHTIQGFSEIYNCDFQFGQVSVSFHDLRVIVRIDRYDSEHKDLY